MENNDKHDDRFFVLKEADIQQHLTNNYRRLLRLMLRRIMRERAKIGQPPQDSYIVIGADEACFGQVVEAMRKAGVDVQERIENNGRTN